MLNLIHETSDFLKAKTNFKVEIGIILGTGLGGLVNEIKIKHAIPYEDIPNFPISTVEGHQGQLIFGEIGGKNVVAMQGRFHFYEGYTMQEVVFPVRVMKFLGINKLVVSNASGGVNPKFEIGDIMIINDHINLFPTNPLIGPNLKELGTRFPDMSDAYDEQLIKKAEAIAKELNIKIVKGVYACSPAPPRCPFEGLGLIKIFGIELKSSIRVLSPRILPPFNFELGSTANTARLISC